MLRLPPWIFLQSWWLIFLQVCNKCLSSGWVLYHGNIIVNQLIKVFTYQLLHISHIWQGTRQWTFCHRLSSIDYQGCNIWSLCIYLWTSCTMACLFHHRYFVGWVVLKQKYYKEMKRKAYIMFVLGIKLFIDILLFIAIQWKACNVLATCDSWIPCVYTKISTSLNII